MDSVNRTCPFCGEEIRDQARKCKHCGEWLEKARNSLGELIWKITNSPIFIFFLSFVLVTGATLSWDYLETQRQANQESNQYVLEVIHRLDHILATITTEKEINALQRLSILATIDGRKDALEEVYRQTPELRRVGERSKLSDFSPLFERFDGEGLVALLTYLSLRFSEEETIIQRALNNASKLKTFLLETELLSGGPQCYIMGILFDTKTFVLTEQQEEDLQLLKKTLENDRRYILEMLKQ